MKKISKKEYLHDGEKIFINKSIYLPKLSEHTHEFLEIVYFFSGNGIHVLNGKEYKVAKGDIFFINYEVSHNFLPTSEDFRWINCVFLPEVLDKSLIHSENAQDILQVLLFKPFSEISCDFSFPIRLMAKHKEFNYIFTEMLFEYENKKKGYQLIIKSYLMVVLSKFFRLAIENNKKESNQRGKSMIDKALDYLQNNYKRTLKLDEIARQSLLSTSYFAGIFKKNTGLSFIEYMHKLRLEEACRLLNETDKGVLDVMAEVGYSDSKFFYDIFKRYTGITPGKYKKRRNT